MWWYRPVLPALRTMRLEDCCEFKASLNYVGSWRPYWAWTISPDPVSKYKTNKTQHITPSCYTNSTVLIVVCGNGVTTVLNPNTEKVDWWGRGWAQSFLFPGKMELSLTLEQLKCEIQGPGPSAVWSGAELQTLPSLIQWTQLTASKMAQLGKELAARPSDLSSSHGTHVEERDATFTSCPPAFMCVCAHTRTYMCTYMHTHDFLN